MLFHTQPKSQKAKGVQLVAQAALNRYVSNEVSRMASIWPYEPTASFPFFARPCPLRPRHGFVDSRMVRNQAEWDAMMVEIANSGEKEAEVIRMPFIEAQWSGILTEGGLTIGPNHDGATSGQGSKVLPVPTEGLLKHFKDLSPSAAGIKESPFIELVCRQGQVHPEVVQVRDGPKITLSDRFVPVETTVQEVVEAGGDLIEWEHKATKFQQGTVVWHPGGSLSSHYAVHCIINKIPVLCTAEAPKVGDVLQAGDVPTAMTEADYKVIAQAIGGMQGKLERRKDETARQWCNIGTAVLHSQALWGPEEHLLRLRGAGVGAILQLACAAVLGELRHRGARAKVAGYQPLVHGLPDAISRNDVYEQAFQMEYLPMVEAVRCAYYDFKAPIWSGAIGGKKWAECTSATLLYAKAVGDFMVKPCEAKWKTVIERLNRVINVSHNCGLFLTKFQDTIHFNTLAVAPVFGFLNSMTASVVLGTFEPAPPIPRALARRIWKTSMRPQGKDARPKPVVLELEAKPAKPLAPKPKSKAYSTQSMMDALFGAADYQQPKPVPKTYVWPQGAFEAQVAVKGDLHFQVKLPYPLNRPYGAAFNLTTSNKLLVEKAQYGAKSLKSLSGGNTMYVPCKLGITGEDLVVRLNGLSVKFKLSKAAMD